MAAESETGQGSELAPKKEIVPQIAEAWGTSRAYVYKLKKRGCPVHDVEAAARWRDEHATRGTGYRSKGQSKAAAPSQSLRRDGAESANSSLSGNRRSEDERSTDRVVASLWDSVQAAVEIEGAALGLVREAQRLKNDQVIAIRISAYTKAQQGRFEAEKRYREEMERQKILVPLEDAKRIGRRAYDVMLPLLRALGKNIGPALSPSDPLAAAQKIDTAVEAIIRAGRGAYDEPAPDEKPLPIVKIELPDEEEHDGDPA